MTNGDRIRNMTDEEVVLRMADLKPCPFCGADRPEVGIYGSVDHFYVKCRKCDAVIISQSDFYEKSPVDDDKEWAELAKAGLQRAMDAWNRRATDENTN